MFTMEAVNHTCCDSGEVKGHYLNITAPAQETAYERAVLASELDSVIIMTDLVVGYSSIQPLAHWSRNNGMILHVHREGNSTYSRQKNHGMNFRVVCTWIRETIVGISNLQKNML